MELIPTFAGFAAALAAAASLTPLVIRLASRLGWVAQRREDRWHERPTALLGGIAIWLAAMGTWMAGWGGRISPAVAAPATVLFLLGLVDDRIRLRPHLKLIGQVAAGGMMAAMGVRFGGIPDPLAPVLTVAWVVGITNAVNLLDNMDGLAAGVVGLASFFLALYAVGSGDGATAYLAASLAGACAGYLIHNFPPARVFMGDCGSMFLGSALAGLAVEGVSRSAPNLAIALLVPVGLLAVPIFDTTLVSLARIAAGRSVTVGGRDHSSHRLVALGLSERQTVLAMYVLTALFGGVAVATVRLPVDVALIAAIILFAALAAAGLYLGILRVYPPGETAPTGITRLGGVLQSKRQLVPVLYDTVMAPTALYAALLIRHDGAPPPEQSAVVAAVAPLITPLKLGCLALSGSYQGIWRHAGMADALAAARGSTIASVLAASAAAIAGQLDRFSAGAWVIDWLVFTTLATGARMGYPMLRALFGRFPPRDAPAVLIVGVGPEALALTEALRDPLSPNRARIVGILDPEASRHGRSLNGVPVLGGLSRLDEIVQREPALRCVLGVATETDVGRAALAACAKVGLPVLRTGGVDGLAPEKRPQESLVQPERSQPSIRSNSRMEGS